MYSRGLDNGSTGGERTVDTGRNASLDMLAASSCTCRGAPAPFHHQDSSSQWKAVPG
eukprot:COSAG01_NODE_4535_length_4945_cov_4.370409_6_plen_57_part_00